MNPDRIIQAQLAYQELLELNIQYEESVLNLLKYPNNNELRTIKEELAERAKQCEEKFTKEYSDLILQGVTFPRNLNTHNATQSL
jgi:glutathione peroxidase-family protein